MSSNPISADCANAMMRFSYTIQEQDFTGIDLPVTESYESCDVEISFQGGTEERSSWLLLQIAANRLLASCGVTGSRNRATIGGIATEGARGRIQIKMAKKGSSSLGTSNVTILNDIDSPDVATL